jgi:hypothetical protein
MKALWIALAALAAAQPALPKRRCVDDKKPFFTGHPFLSVMCPETQTAPVELAAPKVAAAKPAKSAFTPRDFVGFWFGLAYFGPERFLVSLTVEPGDGRVLLHWLAEDYHLHHRFPLEGEFASKKPGVYAGTSWSPELPDEKLKTEWIIAPAAAPYSWEALITHKGKPGGHRLRFGLKAKGVLAYEYEDLQRPSLKASGTLNRER